MVSLVDVPDVDMDRTLPSQSLFSSAEKMMASQYTCVRSDTHMKMQYTITACKLVEEENKKGPNPTDYIRTHNTNE